MGAEGGERIDCVLIAAGQFHDINYARLELLKILHEDDHVCVRVFEDYANLDAIRSARFLVTYTCNVAPTREQQEALRDYVQGGGRWYALHGTNSIIEFTAAGGVDTPDTAPVMMETLGSRFLSHPPIGPFQVEVAAPDHPLVRGVEPFETTDELYLIERQPGLEVLLHTEFEGVTRGFTYDTWPKAHHPVFYVRPLGEGAVLYLTLGHCRGHYDMQPMMDYWPAVERCSWELPVYRELLRRGIAWAKARP